MSIGYDERDRLRAAGFQIDHGSEVARVTGTVTVTVRRGPRRPTRSRSPCPAACGSSARCSILMTIGERGV